MDTNEEGIMKRICLLIIAISIVPSSVLSQTETQPTDLIECIDQIKAWNMSESARGSLGMIAGIRLGGRILSFQKDENSGAYYNSYSGTKCYSPDRNPEEVRLEREQFQYKVDGEIIKLRPLADFNDSGFVSTSEGNQFRSLVEFGYKAAYLISAEDGDIGRICQGLIMNENTFNEMIEQYKDFLIRAKKLGVEDLPEVTID
jgi:hypothetical protein